MLVVFRLKKTLLCADGSVWVFCIHPLWLGGALVCSVVVTCVLISKLAGDVRPSGADNDVRIVGWRCIGIVAPQNLSAQWAV